MVIDHIGVMVDSLEAAIQEWQRLFGYDQSSDIVINTRQRVRVVFLSKKDSLTIKLLEPLDPSSPITGLTKRGGGLHHICFRCQNLQTGVSALKQNGARLLVSPQPGEAFNNREIAFLFAGNNLNIELIDTTEKAGWVESAGSPSS